MLRQLAGINGIGRALALAAALAASPAVAQGPAGGWQVSVFGGVPVSNNWEDVFARPGDLEFRDAGMIGLAYGREWATRWRGVSLGLEGQIVKYFGEQDHVELNLPASLRYSFEGPVLRSVAFGLGLSHATEVPAIEVANKGGSERTMLYWMIESEFGARQSDRSLYARLHHRSTGYGLFGDEGGFNALVLGYRLRF